MKEQQVLLGTFQRLLKGGLKNSPCFYVNNSTAGRFYYHTEHVHGGRRQFHGHQVKKTTSSLETCVGEIENGNYKVVSPLYPRIYCGQLTNRDKGASSWLTQARNQGGARGAFTPPPPPTGLKGPHFDTQYPV